MGECVNVIVIYRTDARIPRSSTAGMNCAKKGKRAGWEGESRAWQSLCIPDPIPYGDVREISQDVA